MEKDIPKFFPKGEIIPLVDRLEKLIDFFQNHGAKGSMSLFSVPGAAFRATKAGYDFFERADFFHPLEIRERRAFVESGRDVGQK